MRFFKVKHSIGHISGMVGMIDVKRKGDASVGYWVNHVILTSPMTLTFDFSGSNFKIAVWTDCMVLLFDHTHDLDLVISK